MRHFMTSVLVLLLTTAQAQIINQRRHELRLDAVEALVFPVIELNYEYTSGASTGFGVALSASLDKDFYETHKFAISPYFRQYFFNKKDFGASGLFVEAVTRLAQGELDISATTESEKYEDWTDIGIGLALGQKWMSGNGFVLEISGGAGRYFLENSPKEFFLRGGLLVGYRF